MQNRHCLGAKIAAAVAFAALTLHGPAARAEFPTLERAIQMGRERAIMVVEAEGELGVANAQMTGARQSAIGNPYTDVQVDRGWNGGTTGTVQALTFTYIPIDIAGQRGKRIEEAEKLIGWRKQGVTDARAIAIGSVVAAYGEVVVGNARVVAAVNGEQNAREEAKYFAGRLEAKDTTIYEKSLADAEVARWVQSRAEAALRVTAAKARFDQLIGGGGHDAPPADVVITPPSLRGSWDDAYLAKMAAHAPIIVRLQREREYWHASTDRYKREVIQPVSLEVLAGHGSLGEARFGLGAVITFPITRRFQGEIARGEAGVSNADRQLGLYHTIVESRLRAARDAFVAVVKAVEEVDKSGMPALERAVSASQEAYKLGKIELQRALLAKRDLALAVARRLDLLEAAWRAYADLVILSGDLP
ncbi:MAG: TolC family protein [Labilithrix sp.]|nr:TolC family protein [Labilithrix sp.]